LEAFFRFYNERRPHSAFGNQHPRTPLEVYREPIRLAINQ
jgi:transposase InsO family protein